MSLGLPPRRLLALPLAEWRHHPWRHAMALAAVALGVALAYSVHLINGSALAEFSAAVRSVNGEPDLVLRAAGGSFADAVFGRVAVDPGVSQASPIVEVDTLALADRAEVEAQAKADADATADAAVAIRLIGADALRVATLAPSLLPRAAEGEGPLAALDPALAFLNPAAIDRLKLRAGDALLLQSGGERRRFRVGGTVAAGGAPLAVVDIAAAQAAFGFAGRLTRIDLRLAPGADAESLLRRLALPADVRAAPPGADLQRAENLSRAYRVNLTVLALVALFVGAFLVYSVMALSVAQRTPAYALLGVLGLDARGRRALVLAECAAVGGVGAIAGLALGAGMALAALRWLAGDLGGGYFPGVHAGLHASPAGAAAFGALGVASAIVGGWLPARHAERLVPAQALKGLGEAGGDAGSGASAWASLGPAIALLAGGGLLALLPPIGELPLAAYVAIAAILFGGVALVPTALGLFVRGGSAGASGRGAIGRLPVRSTDISTRDPTDRRTGGSSPGAKRSGAVARLALARTHFHRRTATAMVAGVVASLALSAALTVMIGSFRHAVTAWLDAVLPADLYVRSASGPAAASQVWFETSLVARIGALPGVERVDAGRTRPLPLRADLPPVMLIARPLADAARSLPLVATAPAAPLAAGSAAQAGIGADEPGVYVSEAVQALYRAAPGSTMDLPIGRDDAPVRVRVLGVWRDYARAFGAIAIDGARYRSLSGDARVNDLALWLAPGIRAADVEARVREALGASTLVEFATPAELRRLSLAIFDRSFAVTVYLQAVAIGIGLVGVAAGLSAQVLARRKEFGLLAHLGLTRAQTLGVVLLEVALVLAVGIALGLALGLLVSVVLVDVVNPQSFHWTMALRVPWPRLGALALAVLAAGLAASAWTARRASAIDAVLAVKEDW